MARWSDTAASVVGRLAQAALGPILLCLLAFCLALPGCQGQAAQPSQAAASQPQEETKPAWSLTSAAFANGEMIPKKHTCDGDDVSPPLSWPDPPSDVAEFALVCNDPDAPVGNWIHWLLYGLPAKTRSLPEGVPKTETVADLGGAKQGENSFGKIGYGGPCPPKGPAHHYHFRLYALDLKTDLPPGATEKKLRDAMKGHVIAEAKLVGLYGRSR